MADSNKRAAQRATLLRVMRYLRPHLLKLFVSLLLALVTVALTLYLPILVGRAIDCIVGPGQVDLTLLRQTLLVIGVFCSVAY